VVFNSIVKQSDQTGPDDLSWLPTFIMTPFTLDTFDLELQLKNTYFPALSVTHKYSQRLHVQCIYMYVIRVTVWDSRCIANHEYYITPF